jgi:citrate synthase
MTEKAKLILDGEEYEFSVREGTEGEIGIEGSSLRGETGAIFLDPGYGSTGSCSSSITFINGEEGVLRYRGYPIEELAEKASFEEVIHLLIWGKLPNQSELEELKGKLDKHAYLPEDIEDVLAALPHDAHPMATLGTLVAALGTYYDDGDEDTDVYRLIGKFKALAGLIHRRREGQPYLTPDSSNSYAGDLANLMFGDPSGDYEVPDVVETALNKLLILHADHEQNCSASTARMVGSARADLYASVSAAVGALSGALHGGANQKVIEMLQEIHESDKDAETFIEMAKDKSEDFRLMGFGHRVYKNFDPRAKILKSSADDILDTLGKDNPYVDIARKLEQAALNEDYFVERRLYPNVDFYSGTIYHALNIPTDMFTVMFALGRLPGWISQRREMLEEGQRIHRPRQVYVGEGERSVSPIEERD